MYVGWIAVAVVGDVGEELGGGCDAYLINWIFRSFVVVASTVML